MYQRAPVMDGERADLIVVGAGLYGITVAVTYHKLHPDTRILILEGADCIGGPWASHRIFPGLKTNNLLGTYQNPDFPMDEARFGVKKGEHVPAEKMLEYLQAFAEHGGISPFIRLNTKVEIIEKVGGGWKLQCKSSTGNGASFELHTPKLILSTGLCNRPYMPHYPKSPSTRPHIIHSEAFPTHFSTIVKPGAHTLVIGAGKSAWDVAYACAIQPNATATMLIRPSGKGPIWMSPPFVTPLKLQLEKLVFTRLFGLMSPCPWADTTGFEGLARRFLQGTWLGRKIVGAFWGVLGQDVIELNQLTKNPETMKLRPWRDAFEVGNGLSILNYPTDWFDLVREGKIKIEIAEVSKFGNGKAVHLSNGQTIEVDAVVCATGWETGPSIKFLPEGLDKELGLPTTGLNKDNEGQELAQRAEAELYTRYPFLKQRNRNRLYHPDPSHRLSTEEAESDKTQNPYRLYRFMVPPAYIKDRSVGFVGAMMTLGNSTCAHIQSLWMTAYLDGTLPDPYNKSPSEIAYETYLETQYCVIRHAMGYGNQFPDLVFDSLPYFDVLLRDLWMKGKRKGNFRAEYFASYGPEDYRGLVDEYHRMQRMVRDG